MLLIAILLFCIILFIPYIYQKESFQNQTLKVYFNGFWSGFGENKCKGYNYFLDMFKLVYNVPVERGGYEDSHILVESVFGNDSKVHTKKWKNTYLFSGEPYIRSNASDYDIILSGNATGNPKQNIAVPYYSHFLHTFNYNMQPIKRPMPTKDVICIISNAGGETRNAFLEELDKHFKVDYAGQYKNNVGGPLPCDFASQEFVDYITNYKFIISMENSSHDSYITEKIFHGIRANIIPVYWGTPTVDSYIHPNRFVRLKDLQDIPRVIEEMKTLAANESAWQAKVQQPWQVGVQPTVQNIAKQIRNLLKL